MLIPFSPPPGINSDDTTFKAEGRWADGSNVRFVDGAPQVIEAATTLLTIGGGTTCVSMGTFRNASGSVYVAYGMDNKLYVGAATASPADKSPVGLGSGYTFWSLEGWGAFLLASPGGGTLYTHTPGGGVATIIATAPARITRMLVTNERQVLAIGCNEESSGVFNPMCIRGSNLEDNTNWTSTATNNAFEHILEGQGIIIGAERVGAYIAVWTSSALYLGQYIGDPAQTYRFDKIASGCGLIGPAAVCGFGGMVYWVGPDLRIFAWSPGTLPQTIECTVKSDFVTKMSSLYSYLTIASPVASHNEIWFYYPDTRENTGLPSRYVAVSVKDGAWFKGVMARTAILPPYASDDVLSTDGNYITVNNLTVYQHGGIGSVAYSITSADQYIEESQRRAMIRTVIPDFKNQSASVSLTVYVRPYPLSTATTKGPYTLTTTTTKKDFRASGQIIAVKFSGTETSAYYGICLRLGKLLFDIVPTGGR